MSRLGYRIRSNSRGKPFESVEWDTIMHVAALHRDDDQPVYVWVYSTHTIVEAQDLTIYYIEKDGTFTVTAKEGEA